MMLREVHRLPLLLIALFALATGVGCRARVKRAAREIQSSGECPGLTGQRLGQLSSERIDEASGLVVSRRYGVLWTHNDSGDRARLFAIDQRGRLLATYNLLKASHWDFEDIALLPTAQGDQLLVADIGDNFNFRPAVTIYRIDEPHPPSQPDASAVVRQLAVKETITLSYAEGPRDAEAVFVVPRSKRQPTDRLVIITKRPDGFEVYSGPLQSGTLKRIAKVSDRQIARISGADLSADRRLIVLRNPSAAFLYRWAENLPLERVFASRPCRLTLLREPQGEAIAFGPQSQTIYSLSEGYNQPLYRYTLGQPTAAQRGLSNGAPLRRKTSALHRSKTSRQKTSN